jgi:Pectate lyase superfamily protein
MTVPYIFADASQSIPLAELDANFAAVANTDNMEYNPPFANSTVETVTSKLSQTVSVKDFGAVGNGVTDDTAAIQAAINASSNVYFPAGTYKVTSELITQGVYQEQSVYVGAGFGFTKINWAGIVDGTLWSNVNRCSMRFEGIAFNNSNSSRGGSSCLAAGQGWEYSLVKNCSFNNFNVGIGWGTVAGGDSYFNTVEENLFIGCGYGMYMLPEPTNNYANNANWIRKNVFHNCSNGIYAVGYPANFSNDFSHNDFEGTFTYGIYLDGSDNTMIGNHFEVGTAYSIYIFRGISNYIVELTGAGQSGTFYDNGSDTMIISRNLFQMQSQKRWNVQTISYSSSITVDAKQGDIVNVGVLTGNITINEPTNSAPGATLTFLIYQDSVGGRTVTWGGSYWRVNANVIDTTAYHWSSITFICDGTWWIQTGGAKQT